MDTILSLPLRRLSGFTHPFGTLPVLVMGIFYTLGRLPHFLV